MKKLLLFFVLTLSLTMNAQKTNEIKLDVFDILALKTLDISFEHVLNSESSVGVAVLFNFEKKSSSFRYSEEFTLTPYYRQHLFDKGNVKFFGELFGSLNSGDIELTQLQIEADKDDTYTDFALGLGFGGKYVSNHGFVVDFHAGIGRNLFNTEDSREIVPRLGISVGKSF
ncbi:DUF3575 domain-containing protein [Flavicella sediminum]|uniref:DUF3575 domain-containing protein n=1 Tax=Flavicella sediminum TaxID=2585141 RepID=UPI001124A091|nr:DUF3575 domain-containing protein [Flavicella sediminum]